MESEVIARSSEEVGRAAVRGRRETAMKPALKHQVSHAEAKKELKARFDKGDLFDYRRSYSYDVQMVYARAAMEILDEISSEDEQDRYARFILTCGLSGAAS